MPSLRPEVLFDTEGRLTEDRWIAEASGRECCQGEQCAAPCERCRARPAAGEFRISGKVWRVCGWCLDELIEGVR